ncbi:MAG: divalent-cation tolerance protein CutA [Pseudomonadota bacterium]
MRFLAVLTTIDDEIRARALASALVEQRLVACAQISRIESVYRWDGDVVQEPEYRLLLKTTEARYPELEHAIGQLHPYETPAIMALPAEKLEAAFGNWVVSETRPD